LLGLGNLVGVHLDQERCAALQVETELDLARGIALQVMENGQGRFGLRRDVDERKVAGQVVGADRLQQIGKRPARGLLLQLLGPAEDRGEIGVGVDRAALEFLQQIAVRWRVNFPQRPGHDKNHQRASAPVLPRRIQRSDKDNCQQQSA